MAYYTICKKCKQPVKLGFYDGYKQVYSCETCDAWVVQVEQEEKCRISIS